MAVDRQPMHVCTQGRSGSRVRNDVLQVDTMANIPKLLEAASQWQRNFNSPLPLGAKSRLAIITCMDSRYREQPGRRQLLPAVSRICVR